MADKIKKVLKWKIKFLISLMLVASGFVSVYHLAYYEKIYPKVVVGGVDISNLSINEAERQLRAVALGSSKKIGLEFGLSEYELEVDKLGVLYKPKETAESAFLIGRGSGFWRDMLTKWKIWFTAVDLDFEADFNREELERQVAEISLGIDEEMIQPGFSLKDNSLKLIPGKNGRLVDRARLTKMIEAEIKQMSGNKILIPVNLFKIKSGGRDIEKALEKAEILRNKILRLEFEGQSVLIKEEGLLALIGFDEDWSRKEVKESIGRFAEQIEREPQDAVFQFDGKKVVEFKPALGGVKVNLDKTEEMVVDGLNQLLLENDSEIKVEVVVNKKDPEVTIDDVNNLGIKELIGRGTSNFFHSIPSREFNVALTASKINGTVVPPGEIFSFNQTVGDISAATGFQSAYIIKDGRTMLGDGGGVCQDSTTIFRAALDAGLDIIERHPHAYRVSYYEQGSAPGIDATVYSPSVDFKFRNDTENHILIQTEVDLTNKAMSVDIYGTSDGRKAMVYNLKLWNQVPPPEPLYEDDPSLGSGVVKQIDWAAWGAKASFDWKVTRNGEIVHENTFYSNYRPWRAVYLRGI